MTGAPIVPVQEACDDSQVITLQLGDAPIATGLVAWSPERDSIIDAAWMHATIGVTGLCNVILFRGVFTATTEDIAAEVVTAARAITEATSVQAASIMLERTDLPLERDTQSSGSGAENFIPAGGLVVVDFSAATTGATDMVLNLRVRTKIQ